MSKELEELNKIQHDFGQLKGQELVKCYEIIFNGLKRLEAIDNANPSEALKYFDKIYNTINLNWNNDLLRVGIDVRNRSDCYDEKEMTKCLDTIKQALLKSQEQEKVLEIIKKKCLTNCNIALVKDNVHYENYCKEFEYFLNKYNESPNGFEITKEDLLTQEEFESLKRYCDE